MAFEWSESHQKVFELIKQKSHFYLNKEFILETDASAQGLGAILSHEQEDGQVNLMAYASRAFSPSEHNYSTRC